MAHGSEWRADPQDQLDQAVVQPILIGEIGRQVAQSSKPCSKERLVWPTSAHCCALCLARLCVLLHMLLAVLPVVLAAVARDVLLGVLPLVRVSVICCVECAALCSVCSVLCVLCALL
jgi:hypothetical protein